VDDEPIIQAIYDDDDDSDGPCAVIFCRSGGLAVRGNNGSARWSDWQRFRTHRNFGAPNNADWSWRETDTTAASESSGDPTRQQNRALARR
jgi:hypothetical protein